MGDVRARKQSSTIVKQLDVVSVIGFDPSINNVVQNCVVFDSIFVCCYDNVTAVFILENFLFVFRCGWYCNRFQELIIGSVTIITIV